MWQTHNFNFLGDFNWLFWQLIRFVKSERERVYVLLIDITITQREHWKLQTGASSMEFTHSSFALIHYVDSLTYTQSTKLLYHRRKFPDLFTFTLERALLPDGVTSSQCRRFVPALHLSLTFLIWTYLFNWNWVWKPCPIFDKTRTSAENSARKRIADALQGDRERYVKNWRISALLMYDKFQRGRPNSISESDKLFFYFGASLVKARNFCVEDFFLIIRAAQFRCCFSQSHNRERMCAVTPSPDDCDGTNKQISHSSFIMNSSTARDGRTTTFFSISRICCEAFFLISFLSCNRGRVSCRCSCFLCRLEIV